MNSWHAIMVMILMGGHRTAHGTERWIVQVQRTPTTVHVIHTLQRPAHLSQDQFACEAGQALYAYTQRTQHETCGMVCQGTSGWGMIMTTVQAHAWCPIVWRCPEGMRAVGVGMHTHTPGTFFWANSADQQAPWSTKGRKGFRLREGQKVSAREEHVFSAEDFAGGAGYLMTSQGLQFQQGKAHVRKVACDPEISTQT